jgi:hypothetical protein
MTVAIEVKIIVFCISVFISNFGLSKLIIGWFKTAIKITKNPESANSLKIQELKNNPPNRTGQDLINSLKIKTMKWKI